MNRLPMSKSAERLFSWRFAPPAQTYTTEEATFDAPIHQEVGYEVSTQAFSPSLNVRLRPALGGYSVGHYKI